LVVLTDGLAVLHYRARAQVSLLHLEAIVLAHISVGSVVELLIGPVISLGDTNYVVSGGKTVSKEVILKVVHLVDLSLLLLQLLVKELFLGVQITAPAVGRQVVLLGQFLRGLFLGDSGSQRLR
jgi:hypothetical protein